MCIKSIKPFKLALGFLLLMFVSTGSMAMEQIESPDIPATPAQQAAEIFYGGCVHFIDDLRNVEILAKSHDWKAAPKSFLDSTKPKKSDGGFQGWVFPQAVNDGPVFLTINRGKYSDGSPLNICTMFIKISKEEIIEALKTQLTLKSFKEVKRTQQLITTYTTSHPKTKKTIIQVMHDGKGNAPVNISVIAVK